jgi:acyl-coenzyme A thioesterase PaaI-like protein
MNSGIPASLGWNRSGHVTGATPQVTEERRGSHLLAAELRRLADELIDRDISLVVSDEATRTVSTLIDAIVGQPRRDYDTETHRWSGFEDFSPISGKSNPVSPGLDMVKLDDGSVSGSVVFTSAFEGPPGHVHGGVLAAAFDEILGLVQLATGNPGMTGRISVHYRRPTPLGVEVRFVGRIESVSGRKINCVGESLVFHEGQWVTTAESEALFISLPDGFRTLAGHDGSLRLGLNSVPPFAAQPLPES